MNKFRFLKSVLASAGLAATMLLPGCTSTEEIEVDPAVSASGPQTVRIGITRAGATTRSGVTAGDPTVAGAESAKLNLETGGFIFFVDAAGKITKKVEVLGTTGSPDESDLNTKVLISEISSSGGAVIQSVPASSTRVYIYMNLPASVATTLGGVQEQATFATAVGEQLIYADWLKDDDFGVTNVPVSGRGTLEKELYYSELYTLKATVELRAVASRIEIGSIGVRLPANAVVNDFKLEAIFINNFYSQAYLDGAYPEDIINHGVAIDPYREDYEFFYYKETSGHHAQWLFSSGGLSGTGSEARTPIPMGGDDVIKYPGTGSDGKVWAYNVFPNDLDGVNTSGNLPHVILHVIKLDYTLPGENGTLGEDQDNDDVEVTGQHDNKWLTVNGYTDGSGYTVSYFERGLAYTIGANGIEFAPEDLADLPEGKTVSALITAQVIDWQTQTINPVY
jgi:hypothetical protein